MDIKSLKLQGYKYLQVSDIDSISIKNTHPIELICAANGFGKFCVNGTPIRIPNGWKNIENLQIGDKVLSVDGTYANVIGVYPQGVQDLYRVHFLDGRYLDVGLEHLWTFLVYNKRQSDRDRYGLYSAVTTDTKQLIDWISDRYYRDKVFIPIATPEDRPDVDLPIEPYTLGVLLGDGSLGVTSIYIHSDLEIINKVKAINGNNITVSIRSERRNVDYYRVARICQNPDKSHPIRNALYDLGLIGKVAYDKFIPKIYLNASYKQRLALLQGLMDTDGYVGDPTTSIGRTGKCCKTGQVEYSTSSEQLAKDVVELVYSLGGKCTVRARIPHYIYKGQRLPGRKNYRLFAKLKCPDDMFTLERKRCRLAHESQYSKYWKLRVVSVEKLDQQAECTCIAIDHPSELYVAKDYIVTHNTKLMQQYAPTAPISTMFTKNGYKQLELVHNGIEYTLSYDASSKIHSFLQNGTELNTSGTSAVQDELVATHLQYDKTIDKLLFNKMRMTQMTPASRMEYLISINPINVKFIREKHAKIVTQQKKVKAQLELLQKRTSTYRSGMMHDLEYQTYLKNREQLKTFDNTILKLIYQYDAYLKKLAPIETIQHTASEYKQKYREIIHKRAHLYRTTDWYKDYADTELHQLLSQYTTEITHADSEMTTISNEINELEKVLSDSTISKIPELEKEYKQCVELLNKYPDFTDKVLVSHWPPSKEQQDITCTTLHKLHNLSNTVADIYTDHIWSSKKYTWHKHRWCRLNELKSNVLQKKNQYATYCMDIKNELQQLSKDVPDSNCISTICPFKVRHTQQLTKHLKSLKDTETIYTQTEKEFTKYERLLNIETKFLDYQCNFHKNTGILQEMWHLVGTISTDLYRLFPKNIDSLVECLNKEHLKVYDTVQACLQLSNDFYEYKLLKEKIQKIATILTTHKTDTTIQFTRKKLQADYERYRTLEASRDQLRIKRRYVQSEIDYRKKLMDIQTIIDTYCTDIDRDIVNMTTQANHTAYTDTLKQLNAVHDHIANILREMDGVIQTQTRYRELEKNEQSYINILNNQASELAIVEQVLNPYSGLPAIYTKHHINKILKNVNYFIAQVFTYPLTVSLVEDQEMKYKFQVVADKVPVGDISNCSDGQMEMIDLAFTLAIMLALKLDKTHPLFLDEIGRCLDTTHTQRLLEMLLHLVQDGYIHQLFLINHQAIMIGGFDSNTADVVCLQTEGTVVPEHYNENVEINT